MGSTVLVPSKLWYAWPALLNACNRETAREGEAHVDFVILVSHSEIGVDAVLVDFTDDGHVGDAILRKGTCGHEIHPSGPEITFPYHLAYAIYVQDTTTFICDRAKLDALQRKKARTALPSLTSLGLSNSQLIIFTSLVACRSRFCVNKATPIHWSVTGPAAHAQWG